MTRLPRPCTLLATPAAASADYPLSRRWSANATGVIWSGGRLHKSGRAEILKIVPK